MNGSHLTSVPADAETASDETSTSTTRNRAPNRPRTERALPSDRITKLEKAASILAGYGIASKSGTEAVDTDKLRAYVPSISADIIGLNNMFFVEMGLLEKVKRGVYKPSPAVVAFGKRYGFEKEKAGVQLAGVFRDSWAYNIVRARVENERVTRDDMVQTLAIQAGAADTSFLPQVRMLLDWLAFAAVIAYDGEYVVLTAPTPPAAAGGGASGGGEQKPPVTPADTAGAVTTTDPIIQPSGNAAPPIISLNVSVQLTADDLAKLTAEQIKSLFEGIGAVAAIQAVLA